MKLPISLLVLAALGQALSLQPVTKRSEAKSLETKTPPAKSPLPKSSVTEQMDSNTTSKRELYEGNYGERNQELSPKYEVTGSPPKIVYAKELQEDAEQAPAQQMFGMRLPQIIKISDVLSQQGPGSFEAAVAKHLYSPISVYQTRHSSPTSFEVPVPAASQSAYSNSKLYKLQKASERENLQEGAPKAVELPRPPIPLYTVNQPRLHFEALPQALDHGLPREIFRQQIVPRKHMSSLFPIYDQLGPFRYPGQVVPSQYLQRNGLYQIIPVRQGVDFGNQEGSRDKNYPNQENQEQSKAGQTQLQIDVSVPKQGYHAHPNGAISFASFSQNLPTNMMYEKAQQQQFDQSQQAQLQSQPISVQLPPQIEPEVVLHSQEQKAQLKQNLQLAPMFQRLIEDLQKYQPVFQQQPHYIPFKQQIQDQPRPKNALQQHLLYQDPRQPLSNPQGIQFQHLPKFKPLPQSLLTSQSFLQQTSRSPIITGRSPRPFSFKYQSTPTPDNFLVQPASTQRTPLPPLKPNYSKYVQPLEPQSHTTPVFLPTPLQPLASSTPKQQLLSDQLISSTTIQPNVKEQEDSEKQQTQEETKPQSQTSQPLKPEIIHQSEPTVRPPSVQSTTYLPFVTPGPQSIYFQYSTPQPQYQSTIRPHSPTTQPPRHDVVIQRQEIQELFFEPSAQPPQPPRSARYQNQRTQVAPQYERELLNLRTQPHHQLFEQLQPLPYQHEDIHSQQYLLEVRRSNPPQTPGSSQYREPQQYLIQQHSHPVELQQFQPILLQSLQPELQQSSQQQHQQVSNQAQKQQHEFEQTQQQQQGSEQTQQQHGSEQTQQQPGSEQTQQHGSEQTQQHGSEHIQQQQEVEQAKQQHDGSEQTQQQQYQEQHLDTNNQIQISTLRPSEDTEKQTETVEIQLQPELQITTGKPNEQPEPSSEPAPSLEDPHLGSLLNPSDLPEIYAQQQQQLVAQPEYSPLLGVPPYSDVQYFGKFAETLFGNRHH